MIEKMPQNNEKQLNPSRRGFLKTIGASLAIAATGLTSVPKNVNAAEYKETEHRKIDNVDYALRSEVSPISTKEFESLQEGLEFGFTLVENELKKQGTAMSFKDVPMSVFYSKVAGRKHTTLEGKTVVTIQFAFKKDVGNLWIDDSYISLFSNPNDVQVDVVRFAKYTKEHILEVSDQIRQLYFPEK
jgi:hypothetical protein